MNFRDGLGKKQSNAEMGEESFRTITIQRSSDNAKKTLYDGRKEKRRNSSFRLGSGIIGECLLICI